MRAGQKVRVCTTVQPGRGVYWVPGEHQQVGGQGGEAAASRLVNLSARSARADPYVTRIDKNLFRGREGISHVD